MPGMYAAAQLFVQSDHQAELDKVRMLCAASRARYEQLVASSRAVIAVAEAKLVRPSPGWPGPQESLRPTQR